MRKELEKFIKRMNGQTTLDEIAKVCKTTEELDYVFERCNGLGKNAMPKELPLSLRLKARLVFKGTPVWEITTLFVQKKLQIGYSKAYAVKDWLIKSKGEKR